MRIRSLATALLLMPLGAAATACVSVEAHEYNSDRTVVAPIGDFGEATLRNSAGTTIGRAVTTQAPTGLLIRVEATGLTPGWHGIHLHSVGECSDDAFQSAGGHVNHADMTMPHGLMNPQGPDSGDLPNIWADAEGRANAEVFTTRARIASSGPGEHLWDADGSAIVIHANVDDHRSQPIGGAGDRVACGVLAAG